jgi:hypothetical protein
MPQRVTLTFLRTAKIAMGKGRKARVESEVVLGFNGALNAAAAQNLASYSLLAGIVKKRAVTFSKRLPLVSASYDPAALTVTLVSVAMRALPERERIIISSARLTDTLGRPITGGPTIVATLPTRTRQRQAAPLSSSLR